MVERAFNKAKHWRAVATRYDKLALTYRAGFTLALIVEWLNHWETRPKLAVYQRTASRLVEWTVTDPLPVLTREVA